MPGWVWRAACVAKRACPSHWTNLLAVLWRSRSITHVDSYRTAPIPTRLAPPELYVGRIELGQIMGVSLATIDRLVAEGMPSVTWGRRTRRFSP